MLKKHGKIIVTLFTIITLVSLFSFSIKATDSTPVVTADTPADTPTDTTSTIENSISTISDTDTKDTEDDIVYGDLYLFDNSVTMDKLVDGNVYIFGNNIKITGQVKGNVFVFGKDIEFTSPSAEEDTKNLYDNYCYITGSIYAVGSKISFNGFAQDIYVACNDFNMDYNACVMRDIRIVSSNAVIKGVIQRDAYLYSNKIDLGTSSDIEEENDAAYINGNLEYYSNSKIEISEDIVAGNTNFHSIEKINEDMDKEDSTGKPVTDYLMDLLDAIIYTIIAYLILNWLLPTFFEKSAIKLKESTLPVLGIGLLALIVPFILALILLFLLFKVALTLYTIWGLLIALSFTVVASSLTYVLKDKLGFENKKLLLLLIITIILWTLKQIPFVGSIITALISIFGLGLIIKGIIDKNKIQEEIAK